jgi:hypothetical protein
MPLSVHTLKYVKTYQRIYKKVMSVTVKEKMAEQFKGQLKIQELCGK